MLRVSEALFTVRKNFHFCGSPSDLKRSSCCRAAMADTSVLARMIASRFLARAATGGTRSGRTRAGGYNGSEGLHRRVTNNGLRLRAAGRSHSWYPRCPAAQGRPELSPMLS